MTGPRRGPAIAGAVVAVVVTLVAMGWLRGALGARLTAAGAPVAQRPLAGTGAAATPITPGPVRVVVLDGLARAEARGPALDALCARGLDLGVDVGFPTKSLPVQSVLWTGRTAQETGVAMRNQLPAAIAGALPARVPGSRAVVEAWTSIASAMGFARVAPPRAADAAHAGADPIAVAAWREGFAAAARDAVASPAPLVLIHVLAIDAAGHRGGRDARYRAEVARADRLLAGLIAAAPAAHWIVLADHGHLAGGGHGDAEPEVRLVRACVAPRPPGAAATGAVHLVDVARHVHDAAGASASGVGRPLAIALAAPDPDATLPRPAWTAWMLAGVLAGAGLAVALGFGRPRLAAAWVVPAAACYAVLGGIPTLSARHPVLAVACGLLGTGLALAAPGPRAHPRRVIALAVPGLTAVLAAAVLAGLPSAVLGGAPARRPVTTAVLVIAAHAVAPVMLLAAGLLGARVGGRPRRQKT